MGIIKDNRTRKGAECKNPSILLSPSPLKKGNKEEKGPLKVLQMLKGMLLVINVWGKWVRMQGCVGKRGSRGGCDSPTCMVTKCKRDTEVRRGGGRGHKEGTR